MILDQAERTRALDPTHSWIVQAPAGSGKTELLVGRFLAMLARVDSPEEVLALTFTRKAAREMQLRILEVLELAQRGILPEEAYQQFNFKLAQAVLLKDQEKNWGLLQNTTRLRISTIDSLCAYLTAQLPITAKFGENFEVTDLPDELYAEAIDQLVLSLKDLLPFNPALQRCLFYLDNRLDRFKDLLKKMLANRSMWLDVIGFGENNMAEILTRSLSQMTQSMLKDLFREWPECLSANILLICGVENLRKNLEQQTADCLFKLQKLAGVLLTDKETLRKQVDKRLGFLPKSVEKNLIEEVLEDLEKYPGFIEQLVRVKSLPISIFPEELSQEGWAMMQDWLEVLKAATAYLQLVFQTRKKVDFSEVALNALQALGDENTPSDILLKLDYQLSHLLVDEYQDTSQHQYRLLSAMTRGWREDQITRGSPRTVFLVGDPMQSIYRFRQADVGLFLKTIEEGLGGLKLGFLHLKVNFRSTPEIIDWINQAFENLFPKQKEGLFGAVSYAPSVAATESTPNQESAVEIYLEESSEQMAAGLAEKISVYQAEFPNHSIAVLVRARSHLRYVLPALSQRKIPYQGVDIENLKERQSVLDCLSLTYALYDLQDQLSWMALLRTPIFGFELNDLCLLAKFNFDGSALNLLDKLKHPDCVSGLSFHAQSRVKILIPRIQSALAWRGRESVSGLTYRLWKSLGFESIQIDDSAERYFELLKQFSPAHILPDKKLLESALENLYARPNDNSANPVEIMTVHKSKGLEFDHVFILMPNQMGRALEKPLLLWQDWVSHSGRHELLMAPHRGKQTEDHPLYDFLYQLEKEKEKMESTRLLYVAATRAKSRLTLIGDIELNPDGEIKKPKSGSVLAGFWPVIQSNIKFVKSNLMNAEKPLVKTANFKRLMTDWTGGFDWPVVPNLENFNHPEKPEYSLDEKILGTVMHRCLELISKLDQLNFEKFNWGLWENKIYQACYLAGASDPARMTQEIIKIGEGMLNNPEGRWCLTPSQPEAKSEFSLFYFDKEYVLDRLFWDEAKQVWVIVDYKFSCPHAEESLETFLTREKQQYQPQLERYAELVRLWQAEKGKRVAIELYLYFPRVNQKIKL